MNNKQKQNIMEAIRKKFLGAFGNNYELEILSKNKVWDIIYGINQEDVLEKLIGEHPSTGNSSACINLESGEIEYIFLQGNENLQQDEHLIFLETLSGSIDEGFIVEDFLDENEIEEVGEGEPWDKIKQLNDYHERLTDAWKFYYIGFNMNNIEEQINKIYD